MIILPGQVTPLPVVPAPKDRPVPRPGAPTFGQTLAGRVLSAQLLMDMARITPFQAMDEERKKFKKFQKMNRQSLRLHQALLPLVSEDETVNVMGMREVASQDGTVIGGDAKPGAPIRQYNVLVNQLALPMKVHSDAAPPKDMPPTPVGVHPFKLVIGDGTFPLEVEVFGQDTNQMVLQKIIQALKPFTRKIDAHTFRQDGDLTLELVSTTTGKDAAFSLIDHPSGFLDRLGLSTDRSKKGKHGGLVHRAQDAMIELDRETFTSPTNYFDLQEKNGLKLMVRALSLRGPLTLEVRRPEKPIIKQVKLLTEEMNQRLFFLSHEENKLLSNVYHRYNGFLSELSDKGMDLAGILLKDGRLALDENSLRRAIHDNPRDLEKLLRGQGEGQALFQEINQVLATPMALGENQAVFRPPLRDQPLVLFLTTASPFLRTAMIAQTEGFFLNLFA